MSVPDPGKVLIVDDDPAMRFSLDALLYAEFSIRCAANVPQARAIIELEEFDVVITDYEMPGESGLELMQWLSERNSSAMVILVTGHTGLPEVRSAEVDTSIVRVLAKPYDPARLVRLVNQTVKLARLRQGATRELPRAERHPGR